MTNSYTQILLAKSEFVTTIDLLFSKDYNYGFEIVQYFIVDGKYYSVRDPANSLETVCLHRENAVSSTPNIPNTVVKSLEIRKGKDSKRLFYIWEYVCYDMDFPIKWATNHLYFRDRNVTCGPSVDDDSSCWNCAYYGSVNGVFVGYCMGCVVRYRNHCKADNRGSGLGGDENDEDIVKAKALNVGYCDKRENCYSIKVGRHRGIKSDYIFVPRKRFQLPPVGTDVNNLYERLRSCRWEPYQHSTLLKRNILESEFYGVNAKKTPYHHPFDEYLFNHLNVICELNAF